MVDEDHLAVILLDVQMPGTDGLETARLIKAREQGQTVPILFVTAVDRDPLGRSQAHLSREVDRPRPEIEAVLGRAAAKGDANRESLSQAKALVGRLLAQSRQTNLRGFNAGKRAAPDYVVAYLCDELAAKKVVSEVGLGVGREATEQ